MSPRKAITASRTSNASVEDHLDTLTAAVGKTIRPLDGRADDRLALMLDALSEAETWGDFETALNDGVLRVYELERDRIRIDSTSAKTYAGVSEEGLFQFGLNCDHRPDLRRVPLSLGGGLLRVPLGWQTDACRRTGKTAVAGLQWRAKT